MRIEIGLLLEIGLVVLAHVMIDQGDRYEQRDQFIAVLIEDFKQFLFFIRG